MFAKGKKDSAILIPKKHYFTQHTNGDEITNDGLASDKAWNLVEWAGGFRQFDPEDGAKPAMDTEFKVLYDDKNLYLLVRAHDKEPHKIDKRLSRRDNFPGDWVEVNIDSYHDKRTAFSFNLSASGVKGDEFVSNDGSDWDSSWDPIWYGKSSIDEYGWIAEMRIPLSQLRFANKPEHVWGLQVLRRNFREQERSSWQYKPQSAPGWVQRFGELRGLKGIKPQKQLEIMPYVVAKAERYPGEKDNPYASGSDESLSFGVDGKVGITSDITLDFTINPDFGQVEADPSQVNLSAFELFFRERRPFFIEGSNIYNFPLTEAIAGGRYNVDNLFYSRRIGRSPSYYPDTEDGEFVDMPQNTTILGALKLTGKNKNGQNWGVMESVTQKEYAKVHDGTDERRVEAVPLTNYLVGSCTKKV